MKLKIQSLPTKGEADYSHLIPIVQLLLSRGNKLSSKTMFYKDKDGWRCDLVNPIDFNALLEQFDIPESIFLNRDLNAILCRNTWIEIKGKS